MKDSPFIYGTTVSGHSFTNRESESAKLRSNLLNGINTTIISPRRWGKSSLVEKVIPEINKTDNNTKTVIIDLFSAGREEYQKEAESISRTQLNLLKAVVKGEIQFTSTAVMQKYALGTPRNVSKNKTTLINLDIIHEVNVC